MATKTQPSQRRASVNGDALHRIQTTKSARVEVCSAPGAGKTFACLSRANALRLRGVPARGIVIVSFSNAAVRELRARVRQHQVELGGNALASASNLDGVTIMTAHALARKLAGGGKVLTDKRADALMRRAISELRKRARRREVWAKLQPDERDQRLALLNQLAEKSMLKAVMELFRYAAAANQRVRDVLKLPRFAALHDVGAVLPALRGVWLDLKQGSGGMDFGDMLDRARRAVGKEPSAFAFDHILVDEYQDCSPAQTQFLAALASLPGRSIMTFGDPDQAIFGFAGGAYTPRLELFNDVDAIRLPHSRRLTVPTAAFASAIAGHGVDQAIHATRPGVKPQLVISDDELDQAGRVASDIERLLKKGVLASEIVVLGRVKALLHPVEMELLERGVLARRLGPGVKRNRKHVIRVLKLVELVGRHVKSKRKIDKVEVQKKLKMLVGVVDDSRWDFVAADLRKVVRAPSASLEGRYNQVAKAYVRLLGGARSNQGKAIRDDVNRWTPLCRKHASAAEMRGAVRNMGVDAVRAGTIHASKGGEWKHVFVVGATDGLLPWHQAKDEIALVEERNLLYVAVTRARESVRLYHARHVHARSRQEFEEVSRFLEPRNVRPLMQIER